MRSEAELMRSSVLGNWFPVGVSCPGDSSFHLFLGGAGRGGSANMLNSAEFRFRRQFLLDREGFFRCVNSSSIPFRFVFVIVAFDLNNDSDSKRNRRRGDSIGQSVGLHIFHDLSSNPVRSKWKNLK